MSIEKQFQLGSTLVEAWLGFAEYPLDCQNPESYHPPISKCQVLCSTATDKTRKAGRIG
jgi:hypothetical protein